MTDDLENVRLNVTVSVTRGLYAESMLGSAQQAIGGTFSSSGALAAELERLGRVAVNEAVVRIGLTLAAEEDARAVVLPTEPAGTREVAL